MEPILEHVKLDWNSDVPIEEQKEAGLKYMRQHCHEILEAAKAARRARGTFDMLDECCGLFLLTSCVLRA